jgi:hypothetical protein
MQRYSNLKANKEIGLFFAKLWFYFKDARVSEIELFGNEFFDHLQ